MVSRITDVSRKITETSARAPHAAARAPHGSAYFISTAITRLCCMARLCCSTPKDEMENIKSASPLCDDDGIRIFLEDVSDAIYI